MSDTSKDMLLYIAGIIGITALAFCLMFTGMRTIDSYTCEEFKRVNPATEVFYSFSAGCLYKMGSYWAKL